jgi:hypothetical protein
VIVRPTLILLLTLTGCFSQPKPECAFLCGEGAACPDGYSCATDGWCKLDGVSPEPDCGELPPDATAPADATVDAEPTIDAAAALGEDCVDGTECDSGFCSDGKCCNSECVGECNACAAAMGASADGTCTTRPPGTQCRAATGPCDVAENCTGLPTCPADGVRGNGFQCDAADDGDCDAVDTCNGVDKTCAEAFLPDTSNGIADACGDYQCPGDSVDCLSACDGNEDCEPPATCGAPPVCAP